MFKLDLNYQYKNIYYIMRLNFFSLKEDNKYIYVFNKYNFFNIYNSLSLYNNFILKNILLINEMFKLFELKERNPLKKK